VIRSISYRRRIVGLAVFVALTAAACSGGDDDSTADSGAENLDEPASEAADDEQTTVPAAEPADDVSEPAAEPADEPADDEPADDEPASETTEFVEDPDQVMSEGEGSGEADLEPQAGGVLRVGLAADGTGFNTNAAISPGSIRIINALTDALVAYDEAGNTAPLLAESVEASDDLMLWTIKLRPGITFHDGVPLDAAAVKANLDAFRASPSVGYGMGLVSDISVVDDLTVEVTMSAPWVAFDVYLSGQPGWMVSPATIGTNETFVSTGPFVLESWTPGDSARVVRNENYWRDGMPYLDAIEFKFIPDATVRRQALEAGDLDVYITPNDFDIVDFLEDDAVDVWIGEAASNESLFVLNTTVPPMDDIRVRRAMAHAIDRDLIIEVTRSGLTIPADGPMNPNSPWYAENDYPGYDPEEAQRLIAEYEAENGPIEFVVKGEPTPVSEEVRDLAVSFWQDAGMDVTQEEIGLGASVSTVIADDFQAIVWAQFSSGDPDGEFSFFRSGGPLNWSNLVSERIDNAFDTGRATADFDARYAAYAEWQAALGDEIPMIWIDHLNGVEAVASDPRVHNIAERTLPDGSPGIALLAGSFFSFEDVWMEQ